MAPKLPIGLRNNNPGNIRKTSITWKGEVTNNTTPFEKFETPVKGIRAMAKLLLNYEKNYKINTCHAVASRWAPPCENNTVMYAEHLRKSCSLTSTHEQFKMVTMLPLLIPAITRIENNGLMPYSAQEIALGIQEALDS